MNTERSYPLAVPVTVPRLSTALSRWQRLDALDGLVAHDEFGLGG
jgi:hypothetical protein